MNIWVEYYKQKDSKNTHAQMKEQLKWVPPNPEDVHKRFCQNREAAYTFAKSMTERGYHATIKTDGI
jgi:hypothetical protein